MSEIDNFFGGLQGEDKQEQDIFDQKTPAPVEGEPQSSEEPHKNRRHRRLEEALQKERESNIALNERIKVLSEQERFVKETSQGEVDDRFLRIYGDTPETRQAWKLQQDLIAEYAARAKEEAIQEIENRNLETRKQQKEFEDFIDNELESIEDQFNVDITSDAPAARKARREFLEVVQQLSPKDEDGTVTGYADFNAAWEMYQLKREREKSPASVNRQKEIASRTMKTGGGSAPAEKQPTPGFRGWMNDYNM